VLSERDYCLSKSSSSRDVRGSVYVPEEEHIRRGLYCGSLAKSRSRRVRQVAVNCTRARAGQRFMHLPRLFPIVIWQDNSRQDEFLPRLVLVIGGDRCHPLQKSRTAGWRGALAELITGDHDDHGRHRNGNGMHTEFRYRSPAPAGDIIEDLPRSVLSLRDSFAISFARAVRLCDARSDCTLHFRGCNGRERKCDYAGSDEIASLLPPGTEKQASGFVFRPCCWFI